MTPSNHSSRGQTEALIDGRKLDYLFNKNIKRDDHNSPRALQNYQQLRRLGFYDDRASRSIVQKHLEATVQSGANIIQRFTERFIDRETGVEGEVETEVRDSLLAGPSGKFAQVRSAWEILSDGKRRFLSAILYGR